MSIPSAWPQVLDFFGTPLVIDPSPSKLSRCAGERADADGPRVHGYRDGQDSGGDCPMRRLARRKKRSHRPKQMERHGDVGKLPDFSTLWVNQLARALNENTETSVPEQVSFRMYFRRWCRNLGYRDHRVRNHYAPTGSCQLFSLKTI